MTNQCNQGQVTSSHISLTIKFEIIRLNLENAQMLTAKSK